MRKSLLMLAFSTCDHRRRGPRCRRYLGSHRGRDYCAIRKFIETQSCVLTSGKGEVGTMRLLNGSIQELLVSRTAHSYIYAQPTSTNFCHATMSVEPVDAKHSRIVYTLLYDQGQMATAEAAAKDREGRRLCFQDAVDKMKAAAEAAP